MLFNKTLPQCHRKWRSNHLGNVIQHGTNTPLYFTVYSIKIIISQPDVHDISKSLNKFLEYLKSVTHAYHLFHILLDIPPSQNQGKMNYFLSWTVFVLSLTVRLIKSCTNYISIKYVLQRAWFNAPLILGWVGMYQAVDNSLNPVR